MSIGSALAASFGIAAETTFGTYVAPTRWYEVEPDVSVQFTPGVQQGNGIAAGRSVPDVNRRVLTTRSGKITLKVEVSNKLFGLLLNMLMGGTPTVAQQSLTTAWLQTHTLNDNVGKFFTAQVGIPDRNGTVRPYTAVGCKVVSIEVSSAIDDLLMATVEIDARDIIETQTLAVPSYPTGMRPFTGAQGALTNAGLTVKMGTFGSEASVTGVTKVTLKIERPQQVAGFYAGANGLKAEPIWNDNVKLTGTIDSDYVDKTIFADRAVSGAKFSLVAQWVGPIIASTFAETFSVNFSAAVVEPQTPAPSSFDVVSTSWAITGLNDLTNNPCTVTYMSVDTVI